MDYKEKYEHSLERCKEEFNFNNLAYSHEEIKQKLQRVFPELKESEDERIKYEIVAFIEQSIHRGGGTPIPQEQENRWLCWLEMQCDYAWSEEDKKIVNLILQNLTELMNQYGEKYGKVGECIQWLMSIKQYM